MVKFINLNMILDINSFEIQNNVLTMILDLIIM